MSNDASVQQYLLPTGIIWCAPIPEFEDVEEEVPSQDVTDTLRNDNSINLTQSERKAEISSESLHAEDDWSGARSKEDTIVDLCTLRAESAIPAAELSQDGSWLEMRMDIKKRKYKQMTLFQSVKK